MLLFRRVLFALVFFLPGGLVLLATAWLVRELAVRERRQKWERQFHAWVRSSRQLWQPPSPTP